MFTKTRYNLQKEIKDETSDSNCLVGGGGVGVRDVVDEVDAVLQRLRAGLHRAGRGSRQPLAYRLLPRTGAVGRLADLLADG